jgi:hypothetical protein
MRKRISRLAGLPAVAGVAIALAMNAPAADQSIAPAQPAPARPYRGVVMQVQALDDLPAYEKAVDKIAGTGADTILITVQVQQENAGSTQIFMDLRTTPTMAKLAELIDYCRGKHLLVSLSPVVILRAPRGDEWRGKLKPDNWHDWFDSYRDIIDSYARVAQAHGVELLVVGAELASTESQLGEWTKTIASVRELFRGKLTYQANWDHYANIPFWDQLDAIGLNTYYTLGTTSDVTVEQIKENWKPIRERLVDFAAKKKKPLIFLEVGYCSLANAGKDPWDYTKTDLPADNGLQERLYRGFWETWYGEPSLAGILMFEWTPGPPDEKAFTPEGKPAEKVLREYFAKPAWNVQTASDTR